MGFGIIKNKKGGYLSGFTLIEIIIVVSIILVLGAVVAPDFFSFNKSSNLDNNVQGFLSTLRDAQNKTLSSENNSQYGVYINTNASSNQYTLFKGNSYASRDTSADQIYSLDNTMEFYNISLGSGDEIIFDRLTGATEDAGSVSIRLKTDASQNKTVYMASSGMAGLIIPSSGSSLDAYRNKDSRHILFNYNRSINTANENIVLTIDNSQTVIIPIQSYLEGGEIQWQGTISVGGENQVIEINTIRLNSPDTLFSVFRDGRYNDKSLKITISGDNSGYLAQYSSNGITTDYSSIYVSDFARQ